MLCVFCQLLPLPSLHPYPSSPLLSRSQSSTHFYVWQISSKLWESIQPKHRQPGRRGELIPQGQPSNVRIWRLLPQPFALWTDDSERCVSQRFQWSGVPTVFRNNLNNPPVKNFLFPVSLSHSFTHVFFCLFYVGDGGAPPIWNTCIQTFSSPQLLEEPNLRQGVIY